MIVRKRMREGVSHATIADRSRKKENQLSRIRQGQNRVNQTGQAKVNQYKKVAKEK